MTTRRLAAILAADVVGFSSMMEKDEEGTLMQIKALQSEVVRPAAENHHGRVVKTTGDGLLIEFASPVEAVRCAIAIQDMLASGPLQMRIGLNLGDIIIEPDGDVYGDGVNIAARLEGIADPGGICISGSVYDQVEGKIDRRFESQGEQQVKNITRPVRVYVRSGAHQPLTQTPPATDGSRAVSDKPSLAVLPFTNLSSNPEHEFFADGLSEDIVTGLSRLNWLLVIASTSTVAYRGRSIDVRQVARDLGVRYILEGSVRASGERIRVTAQLIEARTGRHLWAEKYDRRVSDIFVVQDEITESVVAAIEPRLYAEEGFQAKSQSPGTITAWGLVARAIGLINKVGRAENDEARRLLERALQLEPTYAKAHAIMSWAVWWAAWNFWLPDEPTGYEEARRHAETALAIDPSEPWARLVLGLHLSTGGLHDRALYELETALRINPSFALARIIYAWALARAGRPDAAVEESEKALRLSPSDSYLSLYELVHGFALLAARRFDEAVSYLRKSVVAFPDFPTPYALLISCCGHLGLIEEAQPLLAHRNSIGPPLTVTMLRYALRKYAPMEVIAGGLEKAGVPYK
jgi:adenylate cyclase